MSRVGFGYDAHRLVVGRRLVLGGVAIPNAVGLDGHSDADVLCHAIADALLGAASLGDLGQHFPSRDERWRDASSLELLKLVAEKVRHAGFEPVNVDAVVIADAPPLEPYREAMRTNVAAAIGISLGQVNLKPKRNEGLGFEGDGSGMSARAVASIRSVGELP